MNKQDLEFIQAVSDWRLNKPKQEIVAWWWEEYDVEEDTWSPMADAYVEDKPFENEYRRNITPLIKLIER